MSKTGALSAPTEVVRCRTTRCRQPATQIWFDTSGAAPSMPGPVHPSIADARCLKHSRIPYPPWGNPQPPELFDRIHKRWIKLLEGSPPPGIPLEKGWPEHPENSQCGGCTFYIPLEGSLGSDWGGCSNRRSLYDRQLVFEHWTCKAFKADARKVV